MQTVTMNWKNSTDDPSRGQQIAMDAVITHAFLYLTRLDECDPDDPVTKVLHNDFDRIVLRKTIEVLRKEVLAR